MKKRALRKTALNLIQPLCAALICVLIGSVLFHSYIPVQTMEGQQTYKLSPMASETVFEDSRLFNEIFRESVRDVTKLVMIKEQIETGGEFDPQKKIDINKFAAKRGEKELSSRIIYKLEDLIKWGKSGLEYSSQVMSTTQFVNYFGSATAGENFDFDKDGNLYFVGFRNQTDQSIFTKGRDNLSDKELAILDGGYTTDQLVYPSTKFRRDQYFQGRLSGNSACKFPEL